MGRTGAGKSSLTLALFRIVEPAAGTVVIDGEARPSGACIGSRAQDIAMLGLADVRQRMTVMPQDAVLFSGPVRRNLDPFARHDDLALWRALEVSHLRDAVAALPGQLDAPVAEGGARCMHVRWTMDAGRRELQCGTETAHVPGAGCAAQDQGGCAACVMCVTGADPGVGRGHCGV